MPAEITAAFNGVVNFMLNPFALVNSSDNKASGFLIQADYFFTILSAEQYDLNEVATGATTPAA
jgi:hypothetical protein